MSRQARILWIGGVEDWQRIKTSVAQAELAPFEVLCVAAVADAFRLLKNLSPETLPALAVLASKVGSTTGLDLLGEMQELPMASRIPAVIVASDPHEKRPRNVSRYGVLAYFERPVTPADFRRMARQIFKIAALSHEIRSSGSVV